MRLAYSSNAYLNFSIEETIARIAGAGLRGAGTAGRRAARLAGRTAGGAEAGDPRVPGRAPAGDLQRQRLHDERRGRSAAAVLASRRGSSPTAHYRAIRREHTKRALRLAKELGAPSIQTEPGGPLAPGQSWHAAADVFYDEIMPCVEAGRAVGGAVC